MPHDDKFNERDIAVVGTARSGRRPSQGQAAAFKKANGHPVTLNFKAHGLFGTRSFLKLFPCQTILREEIN